jgi:hypothetical protein
MKFKQLIELFRKTHKDSQAQAVRSVDIALVVRNWLFGCYIVEYEQNGSDRAEPYGKALIIPHIERLVRQCLTNLLR